MIWIFFSRPRRTDGGCAATDLQRGVPPKQTDNKSVTEKQVEREDEGNENEGERRATKPKKKKKEEEDDDNDNRIHNHRSVGGMKNIMNVSDVPDDVFSYLEPSIEVR